MGDVDPSVPCLGFDGWIGSMAAGIRSESDGIIKRKTDRKRAATDEWPPCGISHENGRETLDVGGVIILSDDLRS